MTATAQKADSIFDYSHPPVTEVVCGVLFPPVERMTAPYLGLLWQRYREEYPTCEERPPIVAVVEVFEDKPATTAVEFSNVPPLPRTWFVSRDSNWIVQIQRDRFLHNWRKVQTEDVYPRYGIVVNAFRERLQSFREFLTEVHFEPITPMQYELTYVNQIARGEGWEDLTDLGRLLPDFVWRSKEERPDPFLPSPRGMNCKMQFDLPNEAGRLHVVVGLGHRTTDKRPAVNLELTVRGFPGDLSDDAMQTWFDQARNWIVSGFTDLTGSDIQDQIWGRTHGDASV